MRFLHCGDLHIGKQVNGFSMLEDQKYILKEILNIIDKKTLDGIIIAGDIYDKTVPSAEAVKIFDSFLVQLVARNLKIFAISGNHDSAERIAFGSRIMNAKDVYMSPVFDGEATKVTVKDEYGLLNVYMLPFIKPIHARAVFPDNKIENYEDAVAMAIASSNVDSLERNILITHQFVAGSERSESEEMSVGGTDSIPIEVFNKFDYVALGHIHKPQKIGRETMRYSGSPLKYSFSEAKYDKSVVIVDVKEKGIIEIETVPLDPIHDMVEIKGNYMDIMLKEYYDKLDTEDYFHITLTDEEDIPDALNKLRTVYKNIMKLDYDNARTRENKRIEVIKENRAKTPIQWVSEFYKLQNNKELSEEQIVFLEDIIKKVWEK